MKKVIISSKNPVKINAVKSGFQKMFPDETFDYMGVSVQSEVSDQPLTDNETFQGATNRANNAKSLFAEADYWVGIEGGIEKIDNEMEVFAWVFIISNNQKGQSKTATFLLPKKIVSLVNQGKELGTANDIVFNKTNSKQKNGTVGILTNDIINRTTYYVDAVVLALIPFKNDELY